MAFILRRAKMPRAARHQAHFRQRTTHGPGLLPVGRGTCLGARGSGDCLGLAGRLMAHRWAVSRRLAGSHLTCPIAYQAGTTSLLVCVDGTTRLGEQPTSSPAGGRTVTPRSKISRAAPMSERAAGNRPFDADRHICAVRNRCWEVWKSLVVGPLRGQYLLR